MASEVTPVSSDTYLEKGKKWIKVCYETEEICARKLLELYDKDESTLIKYLPAYSGKGERGSFILYDYGLKILSSGNTIIMTACVNSQNKKIDFLYATMFNFATFSKMLGDDGFRRDSRNESLLLKMNGYNTEWALMESQYSNNYGISITSLVLSTEVPDVRRISSLVN